MVPSSLGNLLCGHLAMPGKPGTTKARRLPSAQHERNQPHACRHPIAML